MSGWRAKIGIISVVGDSFEDYIHSQLPKGVSVISTKIPGDYSKVSLAEAFRCFEGHNVDVVLFAGKEASDEIEEITINTGLTIEKSIVITRKEILSDFRMNLIGSGQKGFLLITPYEETSPWSDISWIGFGGDMVTKKLELAGVTDEELELEDATDYWKYHRLSDVLKDTSVKAIANVYIEDLELGITALLPDLTGAFDINIYSTQKLLWDAVLKKAGIVDTKRI